LTFFFSSIIGIVYKLFTGDYVSFLIGDNRITGLVRIINLLTDSQWPAFLGIWVLYFSRFRASFFWLLFWSINLVVIPYQFVQGSKTFLGLLCLNVFVAYYWTRNRIPKTILIGSLIFLIAFVFPFVSSFRKYIVSEFGRIPSIDSLSIDSMMEFTESKNSNNNSLLKISARYGGIDHLYGITRLIPHFIGYKYGSDYTAIFINLIPRAVWPDKPIYSRGAVYGKALGTITSVTPFPFGEAYWNLGFLGLFVMMLIWGACLGLLLRLADIIYNKKEISFFFGMYFLSQIYWNSGGESSMPMVLSSIPQQAIFLFVMFYTYRILSERNNRKIGSIRSF
jgi:oligosaccharide repeat unit polymerase